MTKNIAGKTGRPATGSIVWADPETKTQPIGVRVTRANGKRHVVRFDPGTTPDDARKLAPEIAAGAQFAIGAHEGDTVTEYAKRWCTWRDDRGLGCVAKDRVTLARHVLPHVGMLPIALVTRDDLKRLVVALDDKARVGSYVDADGKRFSFRCKTGANAWAVARALFRDACRAKRPDLCVRDDNPAGEIAGPDMGPSKAKAYLWPSEFLALVSCERVPVRWRRLFALAVYTFARAGELAALEWEDVDLVHRTIHIHRAVDGVRDRRYTKPTKSNVARRIPIEPMLLPLLEAMRREAGGKGRVFHLPSLSILSRKLHVYLARAHVERADLHTSDVTRRAIRFHDLRASGITWCAIRGDDPLKISQRAGHASFETTRIYLREAENLSHGFGDVFPVLPASLLARPTSARGVSASLSAFRRRDARGTPRNRSNPVEPRGIEPLTSSMPWMRSPS